MPPPYTPFDELRSIPFSSISASYADLGPVIGRGGRFLKIHNKTDADLIFSVRSGQDNIFVAANSFAVYDIQSNANPRTVSSYALSRGTQIQVKQASSAPTAGMVYAEVMLD